MKTEPSSDHLQGVYRITNQFFLLPQHRSVNKEDEEESAAVRVSQVQEGEEQSCGNLSLVFGCRKDKLEIRGQCQESNDKGRGFIDWLYCIVAFGF